MSSSANTNPSTDTCEDADMHGSSDEDKDLTEKELDESDADEEESGDEIGNDNSIAFVISKIPPSIHKKSIVTVPKLIVYDKHTFDCSYFASCHVLSSILSPTRIIGLTSPEELRETAIQTISVEGYKNEHYPEVTKDFLNKCIDNILLVDPRMYCWTNFHLSYLYSHWNVIGNNKVDSLDKSQKKLGSRAWYYVIIFLCRQMLNHPELLKSSYLKSVINCILSVSEVNTFAKLMVEQKLDEPEGINTEHWLNLQVYITSYSKDDNDPSGDDYDSCLKLLIDAGKVKKPSVKKLPLKQPSRRQPSTFVRDIKEEVKVPNAVTTEFGPLPPPDTLLQIYLYNSIQSMYRVLQQLELDKMEYVNKRIEYHNKLVRKNSDIHIIAQRIVAAQNNLTKLFHNQVNVAKLESQQVVLDAHQASLVGRSDVASLIAFVHDEMKPFTCGKVFPNEPPDPGNFPTLAEFPPPCLPPVANETPLVGNKRKLSESNASSPVGSPIVGLMSTGEALDVLGLADDDVTITGAKLSKNEITDGSTPRRSNRNLSSNTPSGTTKLRKRRVKVSKTVAKTSSAKTSSDTLAPPGTLGYILPEIQKIPDNRKHSEENLPATSSVEPPKKLSEELSGKPSDELPGKSSEESLGKPSVEALQEPVKGSLVEPSSEEPSGKESLSKPSSGESSGKESFEPSKESSEPSKESSEPSKESSELSKESSEPSKESSEPSKESFEPSKESSELSKESSEEKDSKKDSKHSEEPSVEAKTESFERVFERMFGRTVSGS